MDKSSSIAAAFDAGKLPSQQQISQAIDHALSSSFLTNDPSTGVAELSAQGKKLQDGIRNLLSAYKTLGENKNCEYPSASSSPSVPTTPSRQHHPRVPMAPLRSRPGQHLDGRHGRRLGPSRSRRSRSRSLALHTTSLRQRLPIITAFTPNLNRHTLSLPTQQNCLGWGVTVT